MIDAGTRLLAARVPDQLANRPPIALAAVTGLAIAGVYGVIAVMTADVLAYNPFYVPAALILLALAPLDMLKMSAPQFLPANRKQAICDLKLMVRAAVLLIPATFLAVRALTWAGIAPPMSSPSITAEELAGWIIFQLLYVAVPEELFFRGFAQRSIEKIAVAVTGNHRLAAALSVIIASVAFAFAHVLFTSSAAALLTFIPSVVFGWIYCRTRNLAVPIAAHFFANAIYIGMLNLM